MKVTHAAEDSMLFDSFHLFFCCIRLNERIHRAKHLLLSLDTPLLYIAQVGQLTWTIVTICMIVAQVKFVAHNIFNGIFWFFFPASLVICNDISAYFW